MDTYTCLIVDDNEIDRLIVQTYLKRFARFRLLGAFSSSEKALGVVSEIEVDVLFCDIQMPGLSGIEFRKKAKKIPVCIFISYSPEYAVESFELETLDYLVKPLTFERFSHTMERIESFLELRRKASMAEQKTEEDFFIMDGINQVKINISKALYLQAMKDYTQIVSTDGKQTVLSNLGNLLNNRVFQSFIRIHRSYAVKKDAVYKITRSEVILDNGQSFPIGKSFRDNLNVIEAET